MSAVGGASGAGSPHVVANPAAALMTRTRTAATPLAATLGRTGTAPSPLTRTTTVSRRLSAAQSPAAPSPLARTDSAEEADLAARIAAAAELYIAVEQSQRRALQSPAGWPHGLEGQERFATKLHIVASGEGNSIAARAVSVLSASIIVVSALMCCFASVDCDGVTCAQLDSWKAAETLCLIFFTLEYFARLATARARPLAQLHVGHIADATAAAEEHDPGSQSIRSFVLDPVNIIDLLAILPFLAEMIMRLTMTHSGTERQPGQVVRLLRILRVVRVLKLGKMSNALILFGRGMARSRDYILTLVLLLLIIVIISGSLIFEAERPDVAGGPGGEEADGKPPLPAMEDALEEQDNAFHHVPDVFWFVVSELTTVGNAPKSPSSPLGQTLAIILMCFGTVFLGFCQAVVVTNFDAVLSEHARTDNGAKALRRLFDALPKDSDGRVKCADLFRAVKRYDASLATALEPFLPLDEKLGPQELQTPADSNRKTRKQGGYRRVGAISYRFFEALMDEARAEQLRAGVAQTTDLEAVATSLELLKEDQDLLREELHMFFVEQHRITSLLAKKLEVNIDSPTDEAYPLPAGKEYHFFISHSQATGGDQANLLATNLEKKGLKIWVRAAALLSVL